MCKKFFQDLFGGGSPPPPPPPPPPAPTRADPSVSDAGTAARRAAGAASGFLSTILTSRDDRLRGPRIRRRQLTGE